jgi:hypothetical protein
MSLEIEIRVHHVLNCAVLHLLLQVSDTDLSSLQ